MINNGKQTNESEEIGNYIFLTGFRQITEEEADICISTIVDLESNFDQYEEACSKLEN